MFPPCRLNERSQAIVTNLHRNIKASPAFQHLTVNLKSELLSSGCMAIEISNQGQPVNRWLYLERPNNQNQSEISKYKPLIVNTF